MLIATLVAINVLIVVNFALTIIVMKTLRSYSDVVEVEMAIDRNLYDLRDKIDCWIINKNKKGKQK